MAQQEMDTTSVLDKYTQDLSNLPLEVRYLLEEIKVKDTQLQDKKRKCQAKDAQLHKFIRANGTLTKHPKELQIYARIEEDMAAMKSLQKDKILLANTALFLIAKHLTSFETDIAKLEQDGLLPPVDLSAEVDDNSDTGTGHGGSASDAYSGTSTPKPEDLYTKRMQKRKQAQKMSLNGTSGPGSVGVNKNLKRHRGDDFEGPFIGPNGSPVTHREPLNGQDDADNSLYCFCQRVSFGEMIGCDNEDCKYEWFHWACVGITSAPKDDEIWYCPDCSPKMEKRKKKRK